MDFYHVKDDYICFLRQFDPKVAENKLESRPYVGIVLLIGNVPYYAPFTSPKPKHKKMKNGKDFRKIQQGAYGAINFNNMIPVPDSALIHLNIAAVPDDQYRRLLQNQFKAIRTDWNAIQKTARELHTLAFAPDATLTRQERVVKARCCDLPKLESVFTTYEKQASPPVCSTACAI